MQQWFCKSFFLKKTRNRGGQHKATATVNINIRSGQHKTPATVNLLTAAGNVKGPLWLIY